jgi:NAD(P)-dependent dehydrogenase (short-subunit alcohol dehydrogenase family)
MGKSSTGSTRVALVTGGGSGIGRALGAELAARGTRVVLADIDADSVATAARQLGPAVTGIRLDVRDHAAFRAVVDRIIDEHGGLDLLVNNAGISMGGPTHELTARHWERIVDTNIGGVINGVLAAYPHMIERGRGHIVNTASGAGLVAPPFVTAYATTKHAVVGLSLGLRPEAALHGVNVSVLCPGAVDTAILDRRPDDDLPLGPTAPVTAREYLSVVGQQPIPADRFARLAMRGIDRNRPIILAPPSARPIWYLHRLSPRLTQRVLQLVAERVEHRLLQPRR